MALMLETIESQINVVAQIRDFVKYFREEKITIKKFLSGLSTLHSLNEEIMEDIQRGDVVRINEIVINYYYR